MSGSVGGFAYVAPRGKATKAGPSWNGRQTGVMTRPHKGGRPRGTVNQSGRLAGCKNACQQRTAGKHTAEIASAKIRRSAGKTRRIPSPNGQKGERALNGKSLRLPHQDQMNRTSSELFKRPTVEYIERTAGSWACKNNK